MALFNRRNKVPEEIQEYYQAERRERAGIAWLLALGTLLITVVLAIAIFFAGRWVWQTVFSDDKQESAQTSQNEERGEANEDGTTERAEDEQGGSQNNTTEQDNSSESDDTARSDEPATLPSGQDATIDESANTEGLATTGANLPSTGPGSTMAVFVAVSILGYGLHRLFTRRNV